jgi:hypothetical protein
VLSIGSAISKMKNEEKKIHIGVAVDLFLWKYVAESDL